jgi:GNAT superfamily N-acetyltransferase
MALQPLLKAHHFRYSDTRMTGAGLSFNTKIRPVDREAACLSLGETFGELDERLAVLALREPTRVSLNPRIPSVAALRQVLELSKRKRPPGERIRVDYGLPSCYDRGWKLKPDRSFVCEGQYLVLVAFAGREPVGYIGMAADLYRDYDGRQVDLTFHGELVYVRPERRGEGYGIDLCVASCRLARELLDATYRAVPPNWTLESTFYADYESEGGAAIAQEIHGSLEYGFDMLREYGKRKSVKLGDAELDAGF